LSRFRPFSFRQALMALAEAVAIEEAETRKSICLGYGDAH